MIERLMADPLALLRSVLLVLMAAYFTAANADFLSLGNLYALGQMAALLGLVTLGLALTMLAGEFDLSAGAMVAVAGLVMVKIGEQNVAAGAACALGFGALIGLANGLLTLKLGVSSLVTTLGVMILLKGMAVWIEGGEGVTFTHYELTDFVDTKWLAVFSPRSLATVACFVAVALMLRGTRIGRDIVAAGSRRKAALMSGARVSSAVIAVFVISGLLGALAGALLSVSLGRAASQFGANLLLQAATAAILGGVALSGGVGTPLGIAMGVLVLAVLNNGLSLVGAGTPAILLLNGGVLLAAVLVDGEPGAWLRERFSLARTNSRSSLNP
ncbi:MAG TPA: ABC transporter permease [Burkholderiaceae bacterium]|nr:ABC transporter permease [Burkholderiaceae bacterium]